MKIIILLIFSGVIIFGIWLISQNGSLLFVQTTQPAMTNKISAEQEKILADLLAMKVNFAIFQNEKFLKLKPVFSGAPSPAGPVGQKNIFLTNSKQ